MINPAFYIFFSYFTSVDLIIYTKKVTQTQFIGNIFFIYFNFTLNCNKRTFDHFYILYQYQ